MIRRNVLAALFTASLLAVGGCGGDSPVTSFPVTDSATRVFDTFGTTGDLTQTITLDKGLRTFYIQTDCIHPGGAFTVEIVDVVTGEGTCTKTKRGPDEGGFVSGELPKISSKNLIVKVKAPEGAKWSVAIDAK